VIILTEPAPSAPPSTAGDITPAGSTDILDKMRGQLRRGDALERDAVDRLIKDHWPTTP
jgi:hypothetical protein